MPDNVPTFTTDSEAESNAEHSSEESGLGNVEQKWGNMEEAEGELGDVESEDSAVERLIDGLRSTEPHKPLSEIESPYDPESGGKKRVMRGIQKVASIEQTEAWFDIAVGFVEWIDPQNQESNSDSANNEENSIETVELE